MAGINELGAIMKHLTILIFSFLSITAFSQDSISKDLLLDNEINIISSYKDVLLNGKGWKHCGSYNVTKNLMKINSAENTTVFLKNRTYVFTVESLPCHGKYKLRRHYISMLPCKELKMTKWTWTKFKIIKITEKYLILESKRNGDVLRQMYTNNNWH